MPINLFLVNDENVDLFKLILQIKHINLIKIKCCKHIKFPKIISSGLNTAVMAQSVICEKVDPAGSTVCY